MKTISELIADSRAAYGVRHRLNYIHPTIYLVCTDEGWKGLSEEARSASFYEAIKWTQSEVAAVIARGVLQLLLLTEGELEADHQYLSESDAGDHWLAWFATERHGFIPSKPVLDQSRSGPRALHFYGFKGGQARSSVLVLLAKALADDGARVLIVDADVEAPSLDSLLEIAADDASSTLMGVCGWSTEIQPLSRVYVGQFDGTVDLLACRPRTSAYDVDFAGFLLSTTFNPLILEAAAKSLCDFSSESIEGGPRYDFVLFDHRTGLSPSVLPLIKGWPGSAIVFARPDGMSRGIENTGVIEALLRHGADVPGAYVTFSLDPKQTRDSFVRSHGKFVENLLLHLSDALAVEQEFDGDIAETEIDPAELEQYWILWKHDPVMLGHGSPAPSQLAFENAAALTQLREVLGVSAVIKPVVIPVLTRSGATDEGAFILTPDFARVFSLDSKVLYIFGRKGTGKTRLARELHERKLGIPLLVAQDYQEAGVQSPSSEFSALMHACAGDYELFWWVLFGCGLRSPQDVAAEVRRIARLGYNELKEISSPSVFEAEVVEWAPSVRRVYLIDGVETAVPAAQMRSFVEALFRFLGSVQYSRALSRCVTVRLFLRSDLQRGAAQNVEQQIEGSSLYLRWDKVAILNFAVARLASLPWFKENFAAVCSEIERRMDEIGRGALAEDQAEGLLLEIFPRGLERNKVKTTTFFATYFSDAGGDQEGKASFYPRLFDGFLREMDKQGRAALSPPIKDGKVESAFVLRAYDEASAVFIDEVKTELFNLLHFQDDDSKNKDSVVRFIAEFSGLKTPFALDSLVGELHSRTKFEPALVREALGRMKQLGIFEDRPGYPGEWRTGRLYKAGLQMKYVRAKQA